MTRFWPKGTKRRRWAASALLTATGFATVGYFVASAPTPSPALPAGLAAGYTRQLGSPGPGTLIVSAPPRKTQLTGAAFLFLSRTRGKVAFSCRLDATAAAPCQGNVTYSGGYGAGRQQYTHLASGQHCFYVRATGQNAKAGPAASYCWTITGGGHGFTVGGNLTSPLYPGVSEPLDLTFTNAAASPLTIARGAISAANITITSKTSGCAASNFTVTQGLTRSITIRAHQRTAVSLSALGVPQTDWPVIKMIDTGTNQDACQSATLRLTYSGIEAAG
ncbi:MAG TPA: hypothetical protein VGI00_15285 [Streptosporangiaceae bacterium]